MDAYTKLNPDQLWQSTCTVTNTSNCWDQSLVKGCEVVLCKGDWYSRVQNERTQGLQVSTEPSGKESEK